MSIVFVTTNAGLAPDGREPKYNRKDNGDELRFDHWLQPRKYGDSAELGTNLDRLRSDPTIGFSRSRDEVVAGDIPIQIRPHRPCLNEWPT